MELKVMQNPPLIEKEQLTALSFPNKEVLVSDKAREKRKLMLDNALRLGNAFKRKVKVLFKDTEGEKQIETTVWAVTDGSAVFKGGRLIPIQRIFDIRFY